MSSPHLTKPTIIWLVSKHKHKPWHFTFGNFSWPLSHRVAIAILSVSVSAVHSFFFTLPYLPQETSFQGLYFNFFNKWMSRISSDHTGDSVDNSLRTCHRLSGPADDGCMDISQIHRTKYHMNGLKLLLVPATEAFYTCLNSVLVHNTPSTHWQLRH